MLVNEEKHQLFLKNKWKKEKKNSRHGYFVNNGTWRQEMGAEGKETEQ